MATLTNDDFTAYKRAFRRDPAAKAALQALAPGKPALQTAFQALEDGYQSRRLAIKGEMEAASGVTFTNALAKAIEDIWMKRKAL